MARTLRAALISGCLWIAANARAQTTVPQKPALNQVVDINLFRKSSSRFRLILDSTAVPQAHQVINPGGILQYHLNAAINDDLRSFTHPSFGGGAALPLASDRIELFGGFGGAWVPFQTRTARPNAWLTQGSFGVRFALDPEHRVWLGTTHYYLADFADKKRQWGYASYDLTFRFGR